MRKSASILSAREEHYGNTINASGVFYDIAPYVLFFTIPTIFTLYSLWATIIVIVVFTIIGCETQISPNISIRYYRKALQQRQTFMSNMTLALSQRSQTPINALDRSQNGLQGEFKTDIAKLEDAIHHNTGDLTHIHNVFENVRQKYKADKFFTQYMQLIENAFLTGTVNREAIDDINTFHNALYQVQKKYITQRHRAMQAIWWVNCILSLLLLMTQLLVFKMHNWMNLFARKWWGIVACIIYLIILLIAYSFACSWAHDESVVND